MWPIPFLFGSSCVSGIISAISPYIHTIYMRYITSDNIYILIYVCIMQYNFMTLLHLGL
jgi:hypothetical protein